MQNFVDSSSPLFVKNGAAFIKAEQITHSRIIDPNNRLVAANTDNVVKDHKNGVALLAQDEVSSYLASSSLVHSLDGWIYLAHAVDSLLKGDTSVAVHLAYYAELRGAMSFLASEGIAVLNNNHVNIDSTGNVNAYPKKIGTHAFVWDALQKYLSSSGKDVNDILSIFSFGGKNFREWLSAIPNANSITAEQVVKEWLSEWSFDISQFQGDRILRNEYSYRPKKLIISGAIDLDEALRNLLAYWNILEPQGVERFRLLDQYLLKKLFLIVHSSIQVALSRTVNYDEMIADSFQRLGVTLPASLADFFSNANNHVLFTSSQNTTSTNAFSIIARSTLLLRLTIGYSSNNLISNGVTKSDMDCLFDVLGINNGFWMPTQIPNDFIMLWSDGLEEALIEIDTWVNERTQPFSLKEMNNELARQLNFLKQFNRAGFWGISF